MLVLATSFGYIINDFELRKENKVEKLLATKWTPYEITITPIPLDENVGIGRSLSFGYIINDFELRKENKVEKLLATKWTPYEITITPIPLDENVGIGRSLEGGIEEMEEKDEIRSEEGKKKEDSKEESKKEDEKKEDDNASDEEETEEKGEKSSKGCEKNKRELDIEMTMAKNEKQRCLEITKLCRSFNIPNERTEELKGS